MIIIYQGRRPYLPLAACHLHFHRHAALPPHPGLEWWQRSGTPFSVVGIDCEGYIICASAVGRHGGVYQRAIQGLAQVFHLQVQIVDVDMLIQNSWPLISLFQLKLFLACHFPRYWGHTIIHDLYKMLQQNVDIKLLKGGV